MLLIGGAAEPYEFGYFPQWHDGAASQPEIIIEYGQPRKVLDRIGWVVGFPARILPLNKKINNHHLSPETLDKLKSYLLRNDLADVCVYVNDYDPKGQWRRLKANQQISPGWRYSVGMLSLAGYTLLPGRIFGGDNYNPYTNTLSLHSDVPAMVLREAARAKCVHGHRLPGTYTFVSSLPLVSLWPSSQTAREVFAYARLEHDWETEREAYHVLCPQLGAEVLTAGTPFVNAWWGGPALGVGGGARRPCYRARAGRAPWQADRSRDVQRPARAAGNTPGNAAADAGGVVPLAG